MRDYLLRNENYCKHNHSSSRVTDTFNTTVDIKLRNWAEQQLPARSVESGWECLQQEFQKFMAQARLRPDHDHIFDNLKNAVVNEAMRRHSWEEKVQLLFKTSLFFFTITIFLQYTD